MMKKLLLGGVVSAAMLGAVSGAEAKPVQLTPEQMMQMMQRMSWGMNRAMQNLNRNISSGGGNGGRGGGRR